MTRQISEDSLAGLSLPAPPPPPQPPPPPPADAQSLRLRMPRLDHVEDVHLYRPGGHHPVDLGDVIKQRYRIIHKLGNGGFALVWLARDLEHHQYVALKILRGEAPERETAILKYLRDAAPHIPITHLQEAFTLCGPNGVHQCLVLDLAGPSLRHVTLYGERPPLPFLQAAAQKLAEGVTGLHVAGVCHGDLTHSNVLFQIKSIHNWTEEEIYRYFGPPKTELLLREDGTPTSLFAPAYVVEALDYSNFDLVKLSPYLLLTDFGEAFFVDEPPKGLGTPATFAAPEMLFGYAPSCAVDLWSLGCLLFEVFTFQLLLPTIFGSSVEALAMAMESIGALPEIWRNSFCDKNFDLEDKPGQKMRWFDDTIERTRLLDALAREKLPDLSHNQQAAFVDLLRKVLVFEPSHRLPAREVLKHPWLADTPP